MANSTLTIPALGMNQTIFIYAVADAGQIVTETNEGNNTSTLAAAAVVLLYQTPPPQMYKVLVETYPGSGSGATNTALALYKDNGNGTVSFVGKDVISGAHYGALDYTGTGLTSGTY
jgi:hypothetical protein